jgi:hypothetical protein
MKIIPIFEPEKNLCAVKFPREKDDEFQKAFTQWTDTEYLESYFNNNQALLYYENMSKEEAVFRTKELADELFERLEENQFCLDNIFLPLSESSNLQQNLSKQKAKQKWLRLYAIKIECNYYVVVGGAIKQSQTMQEHPDTHHQLAQLSIVRDFLKAEGIFDADSLEDFFAVDI